MGHFECLLLRFHKVKTTQQFGKADSAIEIRGDGAVVFWYGGASLGQGASLGA